MPPEDPPTTSVLPPAENEPPRRVGPFDVHRDADALSLRIADRGELSFNGCLLFACLTLCVMAVGILALIEAATTQPVLHHASSNPARLLSPPENHFGLLWVLSIVGLVVGVPLYVRNAYRSALVFTFRRSDDSFMRGTYRVTRLRRIEYVALQEKRDPDERYVYHLDVFYGDGRQVQLHCGYDEREIMNLANEVGAFVGVPVVWK